MFEKLEKKMKRTMLSTITLAILVIAIAIAVSPATLTAGTQQSAPSPASSAACTTPDPFTSLGVGTCCSGGWLPPGMVCGAPPSPGPVADRSLVGVWLVQITPRNCATGDPIPTAAFETLFTFHEDKTMSVSFRNNTLTLERTAAHGLWRRDIGSNEYSFKFVHIRRNVSTGAFAGYQEGAGTLVLAESGDEFTSDGSTAMGCSNAVGTRFKFEL